MSWQCCVLLGKTSKARVCLELWALCSLNPNPRRNPNPRHRSKCSLKLWLETSREVWREPCCGSLVFPLAGNLQLHCSWSVWLCGFLKPNPRRNSNPWLSLESHGSEAGSKLKGVKSTKLRQSCVPLGMTLQLQYA